MPFYIDRFKASPAVRAMHPTARAGYLYLLTCQWQTDECSISADPLDLAEMSELGDELWAQFGPRILRKFEVLPDGRLRNRECFAEWEEAKRVFYRNHVDPEEVSRKRSESGRKGNALRWGNRKTTTKQIAKVDEIHRKTSQTVTVTGTETVSTSTPPSARANVLPLPTSPGSKGEFQTAYWLQQELGMPATANDMHVLAQAVMFVSRDLAFGEAMEAGQWLYREARAAEARGQPVNIFWFRDGKYKQPNGGSNATTNRSQQRTNGNLAALAAVRAERHDRELAGAPGGSAAGVSESRDIETLFLPPGEVLR